MRPDQFIDRMEIFEKRMKGAYPFRGIDGQRTGILYNATKDWEPRDITAGIRKDIKESVKEGNLPEVNYSVRLRYNDPNTFSAHVSVTFPEQELQEGVIEQVRSGLTDVIDKYTFDHGVLVGEGPQDHAKRFFCFFGFYNGEGERYKKHW